MMHFLQSYSCPPPQAGEGFPLVIPVIIVAGLWIIAAAVFGRFGR